MALHWTYCEYEPSESFLQQGDILARTEPLLAVLEEVLAYFCDPRYTGFVVTTQSCDLFQRDGRCKAEHISLAVIQELEPLLPDLLEKTCGTGIAGVYRKESRRHAEEMLKKIINQNDQARGLFYLHRLWAEERERPVLATPSVALLRVSIALRQEHYEVLRDARRARLEPKFANKLGWLVGNLYARPGTPDWEEMVDDPKASAEQSRRLLEYATERKSRALDAPIENWVSEAWMEAAKKKGLDLTTIPSRQMSSTLQAYAPKEPLEIAARCAGDISYAVLLGPRFEETRQKIRESETFHEAVVERVVLMAESIFSADERTEFRDSLLQGALFRQRVADATASIVKETSLEIVKGTSPENGDHLLDRLTEKLSQLQGKTLLAGGSRMLAKTAIGQNEAKINEFFKHFSDKPALSRVAIDEVATIAESLQRHSEDAQQVADRVASRLKSDREFKNSVARMRNAAPPADAE